MDLIFRLIITDVVGFTSINHPSTSSFGINISGCLPFTLSFPLNGFGACNEVNNT